MQKEQIKGWLIPVCVIDALFNTPFEFFAVGSLFSCFARVTPRGPATLAIVIQFNF